MKLRHAAAPELPELDDDYESDSDCVEAHPLGSIVGSSEEEEETRSSEAACGGDTDDDHFSSAPTLASEAEQHEESEEYMLGSEWEEEEEEEEQEGEEEEEEESSESLLDADAEPLAAAPEPQQPADPPGGGGGGADRRNPFALLPDDDSGDAGTRGATGEEEEEEECQCEFCRLRALFEATDSEQEEEEEGEEEEEEDGAGRCPDRGRAVGPDGEHLERGEGHQQTGEEAAECWVCFRGGVPGNRLIAPCGTCSGSMGWIHVACMAEWLKRSWCGDCPNCKHAYKPEVLVRGRVCWWGGDGGPVGYVLPCWSGCMHPCMHACMHKACMHRATTNSHAPPLNPRPNSTPCRAALPTAACC